MHDGPGLRSALDAAAASWTIGSFDLRSRADRARVYEIVLQEGTPADILTYIDGVLLVDLWEDLVLPRGIRSAWAPLISASSEADA